MAQTPEAKENVDSILVFLFLKRLVTPIVKTDAFKLGLINNVGIQISDGEIITSPFDLYSVEILRDDTP